MRAIGWTTFTLFYGLLACSYVAGQTTLTVTGEVTVTLYVNGVQRFLLNGGDYERVDQILLAADDRLLAFHGTGNGFCSGIIASTTSDEVITDYRFRCTNQYYNNWMNLGYEDYSWPTSFIVSSNDGLSALCPKWSQIPEISSNADWIWTANISNSEDDVDKDVYCRGYLPVCANSPCLNGAYCDPDGIDSVCVCRPGYTGQFCETHLIQPCGDLLRLPNPQIQVPESWDLYCYLSVNDTNYLDYQCRELLLGIPDYEDASGLLAAGGAFGCWAMKEFTDESLLSACQANYQHDRQLGSCLNCNIFGVCIRLPSN